MNRFDGNLHYALLAYNRGPTTVREILAQGEVELAGGWWSAVRR